MHLDKIFLYILLFFLLIGGFFLWYQSPNMAYVNTIQVYEKFDYKQELEADLMNVHKAHGVILDSIKFKFEVAIGKVDSSNTSDLKMLEAIKKEYMLYGAKFKEEEENLKQQYVDKIWNQLDIYAKSYCEEEGYDYVFGVKGEGNLIYANEINDITDALITFVNSKYQNE